jgi:O-antigen/teichoic acid export membrane protein
VSDRTRKAAIGSALSYAQFGLVIASGLVVFPIVIHLIGPRDYGLWLATGEVAGYVALLEPGVFALLPWLVATADGKNDPAQIRQYLSDSLLVGVGMGGVLAGFAVIIWTVPAVVSVATPDQAGADLVREPLALLLALVACTYPFKTFVALIAGLQDTAYAGVWVVLQTVLTVGLTLGLVAAGFGLTGLALAAGVPVLLAHLAAVPRAVILAPHLVRGLPPPHAAGVWHLVGQGAGSWLASMGYRLMAASNGIILSASGRPEWATVLAATGKASQLLQQACWTVPDSGLVGAVQLHGQGDRAGVRRVVLCILHLHVLITGSAVLGLLLFNPAFVRAWVGPGLYAGNAVNLLLAAGLFLSTLIHAAFTLVGLIGYRLAVGGATLLCGGLYVGLAVLLVRVHGIAGLVEASLISGTLACLIPGAYLLTKVYEYTWRELSGVVGSWAVRAAPFVAACAGLGMVWADAPVWQPAAAGVALGVLYLGWMRPFLATIPWPVRVGKFLTRFRIIPTL